VSKDPSEVKHKRWFRSKGGSYAQVWSLRPMLKTGKFRIRLARTGKLTREVYTAEAIAQVVSRWLKHKPPKSRANNDL